MDESIVSTVEKVESELEDEKLLNGIMDNLEKVETKKRKVHYVPQNMVKYTRYTKEETERFRLRAKILTKCRTKRGGAFIVSQINENFFKIDMWPLFIYKILLKSKFGYHDRLSYATFFHGNGWEDKDMLLAVFEFFNEAYKKEQHYHSKVYRFFKIFDYLKLMNGNDEQAYRIRSSYWFYSMFTNNTMYYDGYVRAPNGEKVLYISHRNRNVHRCELKSVGGILKCVTCGR